MSNSPQPVSLTTKGLPGSPSITATMLARFARFAQPRADRQVNREGRRTPHVIWDRFVKLKLHTPQPVGYVGVVEALDENLPGVRVVVGNTSRSRVGIGE